jgi:putative isomerase
MPPPSLRHATIPLARAWNTWSPRPAEMVFLPLGVRLTPVAYAASTGTATLFPPGPGVRLGRHELDGSLVGLSLAYAGTALAWTWAKPAADPFAVVAAWRAEALGEWGLRFWVNLALSAEGGEVARRDPATGTLTLKVGHRFAAVVAETAPVLVTGHDSVGDLAAEYEAHGYFDPRRRADEAPVLAMRFNLEMTRANRVAAAVADDPALAAARARGALAAGALAAAPPLQEGVHPGSLDAVRDVIAWNTVWDAANARPYTAISRNWDLGKFGGWGVWLDDQLYMAHLAGLLDEEAARENLAAALAGATPQGNLPCLLTARDAWVDRTQIPVASFLVRLAHLRTGSRAPLELAWPALSRNHDWWWASRDPGGRGLCSYGTSGLGEGMYAGTHFGARNESSMDNSPIHDEADYDPATRTLTTLDVGLNSLLALDAEMLAGIGLELGLDEAAARYSALAERTRARIAEELWDEDRSVFANRLRSGRFVRSVGPTSFYPLVAGAVSPERLPRLLAQLDDPRGFAGRFVLPSVRRDDPAYADNTYWRGRAWPPLNWLVWQGLRRAGEAGRATALAEAGLAMFRAAWEGRRLCPENYNAETGEPLDQPDTEGFYGWGALLPALGVAEVVDVSPWEGWSVANGGRPLRVGPLLTPAGRVVVSVGDDGALTLRRGAKVLLRTTATGRITRLELGQGRVAMDLPPQARPAEVVLPARSPDEIVVAELDGAAVRASPAEDGARVELPASARTTRLVVLLRA